MEYGVGQPRLEKFRLQWELAKEPLNEPPLGQVSVADKEVPTEARLTRELTAHAEPFLFTRGLCDVGPIQRLLLELGEAAWSEDYAKAENVCLERPSHDAWGIGKLAFAFCDDFLRRVYYLPLWTTWEPLLLPIFECCGVDKSRIVRCLLARLPPKTVIPPHHDSGYWVKRTHRLHCAIFTDTENIVFKVGKTVATMRRFKLEPGRVVELNNQAKHYVSNLSPDMYRTHLIFDYLVEPLTMPPICHLKVGDELLQTRRSIDLKSERGAARKAPHFLIIGAQKAGTTSMYEYLCRHPLVIRGKRRETHFLDWRWPKSLLDDEQRQKIEDDTRQQQRPRDENSSPWHSAWHSTFFDASAHYEHPSLIAGDSTPSYLLASHLAIPRLKLVFENDMPPFIVMLRDPADRALSHYAMIVDENCTPAQRRTRGTAWLESSLEEIAHRELRDLVDAGLLKPLDNDVSLKASYAIDSTKLKKVLEQLPNTHGSHSLLLRGLYALQLEPWLDAFSRDNFLFVNCEDLATPQGADRELARAQRHIGLPEHPLDGGYDRHNARINKPPTDDNFLQDLRRFYEPFNRTLFDLLGWKQTNSWPTGQQQ